MRTHSRHSWHFCIEFWNSFLEKIKEVYCIAPFLVFTYSVFMLINSDKKEKKDASILCDIGPERLFLYRPCYAFSVCAITRSWMCVSKEPSLPQSLYVNVQLIAVKKFLFLVYLKEETMEGSGAAPLLWLHPASVMHYHGPHSTCFCIVSSYIYPPTIVSFCSSNSWKW